METLTLNDGTVVNGHILESGNNEKIFVRLTGMSLVDGVMLFSDTEKTINIVAMNHGVEHVYYGYTILWSANAEFGNCNLVMRKDNNA